MRCIGIIGGMSWESTAHYYRALNEGVRARLGGHHSARLLLHSVDFAPLEAMQREGRWAEVGGGAGRGPARPGGGRRRAPAHRRQHHAQGGRRGHGRRPGAAPPHRRPDRRGDPARRPRPRSGSSAPATPWSRTSTGGGWRSGTASPCSSPRRRRGPRSTGSSSRSWCSGWCGRSRRRATSRWRPSSAAAGAQGIVAGCTEIGMLLQPGDLAVPLFDTAELHVAAALDAALAP